MTFVASTRSSDFGNHGGESSMNPVPNLQFVWNRDWINLLYEPNTFIGSVVESAFERAENPDLGPLPAEALEAFKSQVRRNG